MEVAECLWESERADKREPDGTETYLGEAEGYASTRIGGLRGFEHGSDSSLGVSEEYPPEWLIGLVRRRCKRKKTLRFEVNESGLGSVGRSFAA